MNPAGNIDEVTYLGQSPADVARDARRVPKGAIVCVRGWAAILASDRKPDGVFVSVENGPPIEALYGDEREDVARAIGDERQTHCGFRAMLSTADIVAGLHVVTLSLRDPAGHLVVVGESDEFWLDDDEHLRVLAAAADAAPATMAIDALCVDGKPDVEPLGLSQTNVLEIGGWAIDATARAAATSVFGVIGPTVVKATYGHPRPDVAALQGDAAYRNCGFSLRIAMDTIAAGSHLLKIRVLGADGESVFVGDSIRVDVSSPLVETIPASGRRARGSLDETIVYDFEGQRKASPVPLRLVRGDRLLVRGWAVDERSDRIASAVHVCVDDRPALPAVYKIDRVDVAQALGRPDLLSCGFLGIVATTDLRPGAHLASIRVVGSDGRDVCDLPQSVEFLVGESA